MIQVRIPFENLQISEKYANLLIKSPLWNNNYPPQINYSSMDDEFNKKKYSSVAVFP
jgi:hypothetical protein